MRGAVVVRVGVRVGRRDVGTTVRRRVGAPEAARARVGGSEGLSEEARGRGGGSGRRKDAVGAAAGPRVGADVTGVPVGGGSGGGGP